MCDAIEAICPLIEFLEDDVITKTFLPQLLPFLDFKSHTTFEITEIFAKLFGEIVHNLSKNDHVYENKFDFMQFYKEMLGHE